MPKHMAKCSERTKWLSMKAVKHLADGSSCTTISSSLNHHTRYDDGAPCDFKESGGKHCLMESATVRQVVTWLQKFGDQIPKKLGHVRSSPPDSALFFFNCRAAALFLNTAWG
jgi:hypothetical protein